MAVVEGWPLKEVPLCSLFLVEWLSQCLHTVKLIRWLGRCWDNSYFVFNNNIHFCGVHTIVSQLDHSIFGITTFYTLKYTFLWFTSMKIPIRICLYPCRFRFPNIVLVYISITRIVFCLVHIVGYTDEEALFCTQRDLVASYAEGGPYCDVIGKLGMIA